MISRNTLKRIRAPFRRVRGLAAMAIGRAGSARPLSRDFGYSRGTPIDRFYIERFLAEHRLDIRGHVLEIGDDHYSRRFGDDRVTRQDVLHLRPGSPQATIFGDLAKAGVLPDRTFDCIVMTQTLHLIFDLRSATTQVCRALKPGGVALITVPGISPIDHGEWKDSWCWSLTDVAMRRLLDEGFGHDRAEVSSFGNLLAATAFLHGAAVEEVGRARLERFDAAFPVTVAARVVRAGSSSGS